MSWYPSNVECAYENDGDELQKYCCHFFLVLKILSDLTKLISTEILPDCSVRAELPSRTEGLGLGMAVWSTFSTDTVNSSQY